jgi:hypothetical protein
MELFGHRRQGAAHDFPARIDEFVLRTGGVFGEADSIIFDHTLLPFYLPFRGDRAATSAINALRSGCLGGIKARLGILASGFGASHPLKACVDCMAEDLQVHNVRYWHLEHQWPACWVCHRHGKLLRYALGKVNAEARFDWLLPGDLAFSDPVDHASCTVAMPVLAQLAESASGLGRLPRRFHFEMDGVSAAYRARLVEIGVARSSGRLRLVEFGEVLSRVCVPLAKVYGLSVLSGDATNLSRQFGRLAHDSRTTSHPLWHLILIVALFASWEAFLQEYGKQSTCSVQEHDVSESTPADGDAATDPRSRLIVQYVARGQCVTAAARNAGVAVGTAMAWVARAGGKVGRRPKKFRAELRAEAIARLRKGEAKEDVAIAVGVSIQSVTRLLRTEAGLSTRWNSARFFRRQVAARTAWKRTLTKLDRATVKSVRSAIPAHFTWLYRNDRAWLDRASSALSKDRNPPSPTVRWDDRDRKLAMEINSVAKALHAMQPGKRLKLSQLCNSIPALKPLLSQLQKMPLTRCAIQTARSTPASLP